MLDIGKRISDLMEERGWTQGDLYRRSGIKQPHISQIISGKKKNITKDTLEKFSAAFGITLDELSNEKTAMQLAVDSELSLRPSPEELEDVTPEEAERAYAIFDRLSEKEKEKRLSRFIRSATAENGKVKYELISEEELFDILEKISRLPQDSRQHLSAFLDSVVPRRK